MQVNSRLSDDCKLTDAQMRDFIVNGYLTIKTDLPRSVHETIYRKTLESTEKEGNLGNNILPRVPELQAVFEDPAVRGAFTSILGENYVMHSHRHPHQNRPHSDGQGFHKDSYWGYEKVRHHRPALGNGVLLPTRRTARNGTLGPSYRGRSITAPESLRTTTAN